MLTQKEEIKYLDWEAISQSFRNPEILEPINTTVNAIFD